MPLCFTEWEITGIVSFAILLIGIAIQAALKWAEVSHTLKFRDEEIAALRIQIKSIERERNDSVAKQIAVNNATDSRHEGSPPERHDEKKEKILLYLAHTKDAHLEDIAHELNYEKSLVKHNLEILKINRLAYHYWRKDCWNISPDGHAYIAQNKLIT
jgi:hypothetical protein